MKKPFYFLLLLTITLSIKTIAKPTATITTATIAAANINQGSTYNVVYAAKMKVTVDPVTINNIKFTLSGTHDNNDLVYVYVYYNAAAPVISGATYLGYAAANYAGPHQYSINVSKAMAVNEQGYFIIAVNLTNNATDNRTIQVNGATNPVVFGYSVATTLVNNQANNAAIQTIQAADITLTTPAIATENINQGSTYNVIYAAKMKVLTEPVTVNNIQFTLNGNHDNNDLTYVYVYYNAAAPVISGATYLGYAAATYAAPHNYSVNISKAMTVAEQGFYIIAVNVSNTANDNRTIVINGATDPVEFGFTTAPNVTNGQTDKAKQKKIQAADITLATPAVATANINQGSTYNVIYAAKMTVATMPVTVNNIQFTLNGTHDFNDLTYVYVYYNAAAPVISGATYLGYSAATYAAPHDYSINISKAMAVEEQGFFIIAVSVSNTATDNRTIVINGETDPVGFGFATAPNVTNGQTDKAKQKKIQAADITLTTPAIAAASISQGSTYNVVYATKMSVTTMPVTVNNIQFTLGGNHDNNDLTYVYVYYNTAAPVISGATYLGYAAATFAAPHDYSINISKAMTVDEQGYFIIAVNVSNTANDNRKIVIDGATNPVEFGFATAPNVTNSQSNKAKTQTIQAADIKLTTPTIAAGNIAQGSTYNVVYAAKMNVTTMPVTVNNIQFTLSGNHDNNDLTYAYVYYNAASPVISGATYLGYSVATYAAPHDYSINISKAMAVGDQGFFIVAVNLNATASVGKTVKVNGANDPAIFGFATKPNVADSQSNKTGTKTIVASFAPGNEGENIPGAIAANYTVNKLFPNPANAAFNFSIKGKQAENITAQLTNRSGNVMLSKKLSINSSELQHSMNVSALPNGSYYLVLTNKKGLLISRQQVNVQH